MQLHANLSFYAYCMNECKGVVIWLNVILGVMLPYIYTIANYTPTFLEKKLCFYVACSVCWLHGCRSLVTDVIRSHFYDVS